MYKKLTSLFFILPLILSFNVLAKECVMDGSAASYNCLDDLNNENNKANDRALLLIGVLSYGVFSLRTSDKDEEEKEELLENFRSGKGLELYKKNDYGVYLYQQKKLENYSAISHEEDFKKFIEPTSQILSIEYKLH